MSERGHAVATEQTRQQARVDERRRAASLVFESERRSRCTLGAAQTDLFAISSPLPTTQPPRLSYNEVFPTLPPAFVTPPTHSLSPLTKRVWDEGKVCPRPRPARPSVRCSRQAVNAVMPRQGEMPIPAFTACPWHAATRSVTQIARQRAPFLHRRRHTPFYPRPPCSDGGGGSGEEEQQVVAARQRLPSADGALMNRYRSRLKLLLALPPQSLSLFPPPSHVAARQPPPRRKALLSAAQRMDARRMEPLANSSACVRARLPLRHQLGRLCPATQRRPRPSGSGPPEDGEDRIVSAVDDELPSGRVGRERGARCLQRDGTNNCNF